MWLTVRAYLDLLSRRRSHQSDLLRRLGAHESAPEIILDRLVCVANETLPQEHKHLELGGPSDSTSPHMDRSTLHLTCVGVEAYAVTSF